ncbi:MAG: saccharopine dehydrogenase NADP-binding domain-containing protein [Clostridiales Family XIII bacterium]|jgi:saccharopine dehydrogenase (NAD+, L-lysine-forming)|nr:saccharopine dehydrogenase NADP-binding domain-containing protein [Clostridiales Family XIII bacterium]
MKIVLLGAGLQGIATALDLSWNENIKEVLIADFDPERAQYVSDLCNKKYGNKTKAVQCDVTRHAELVELIRGFDLVINEVNYYFNTRIMDACLEAKVNYADIGGLYVETVKQMKYMDKFKEAGIIGLIGIGGTPGVTNVCARWAADRLDTVEAVDVYCACDDWSSSKKTFEVTYAIETIMDEFYMKPIQFIDGDYVEVEPRSGGEVVQYPKPIGDMHSYYIMHSEIGSIPENFKDKGIRRCTFRIGFPDNIKEKLEFLHGLGFSRSDLVEVDGVKIKPVRALKRMMDLQPDDPDAIINDCDIIKTVVTGTKNGKRLEYTLEMVCRPIKRWPELLGAQVYIGGAPAWAAELMRRGLIKEPGAFAPEACIPPEAFFEEAAKREMYITATTRELIGSSDWAAVTDKGNITQTL